MMNEMSATGFGPGFPVLWTLHILAVILFFVGIVFLLLWAHRTLTAPQLKKWGWSFVIGGTILCLFTIGIMGHSWNDMDMNDKRGGHMMHSDNDEAMSMSMNDMSSMLEGKKGDAFDAAFLAMMIPHHEGAIEMAELAKTNAGHAELKNMANEIITAQQTEIAQMKAWQKSWGFTQ